MISVEDRVLYEILITRVCVISLNITKRYRGEKGGKDAKGIQRKGAKD
jgi:hypothetical protein